MSTLYVDCASPNEAIQGQSVSIVVARVETTRWTIQTASSAGAGFRFAVQGHYQELACKQSMPIPFATHLVVLFVARLVVLFVIRLIVMVAIRLVVLFVARATVLFAIPPVGLSSFSRFVARLLGYSSYSLLVSCSHSRLLLL